MPPFFIHNINHIGLSVPDFDCAVQWYTDILGFRVLCSSLTANKKTDVNNPVFRVFDNALQEVKIAFLATGNGVGLELFEFQNPKCQESKHREFDQTKYARGGFFHVCITAPDPQQLCGKVVVAGGRKLGGTVHFANGNVALYVQDLWGNVLELMSCSFEQLLANQDQFP